MQTAYGPPRSSTVGAYSAPGAGARSARGQHVPRITAARGHGIAGELITPHPAVVAPGGRAGGDARRSRRPADTAITALGDLARTGEIVQRGVVDLAAFVEGDVIAPVCPAAAPGIERIGPHVHRVAGPGVANRVVGEVVGTRVPRIPVVVGSIAVQRVVTEAQIPARVPAPVRIDLHPRAGLGVGLVLLLILTGIVTLGAGVTGIVHLLIDVDVRPVGDDPVDILLETGDGVVDVVHREEGVSGYAVRVLTGLFGVEAEVEGQLPQIEGILAGDGLGVLDAP